MANKSSSPTLLDKAMCYLKEHLIYEEFENKMMSFSPYKDYGNELLESVEKIQEKKILSDEEILENLMMVADSLELYTDLGSKKVSKMFKQSKEELKKYWDEFRCVAEYECRHLKGRQKDIETIWNGLKEGYVGVCITGMAGNGKTTLAEYIGLQLKLSGKCFEKINARNNSLSQLLRNMLQKFDESGSKMESTDILTRRLCDCLENYKDKEKEKILLLDNIDDIQEDWAGLLTSLEKIMNTLVNNPDSMVKILITSRRKLESDRGIEMNMRTVQHSETCQLRFNHLFLEVELKPLTSGILLELIDTLLPDSGKMSDIVKSQMVAVCAQTPLLIHTLCNTVQNNPEDAKTILRNIPSLMTFVTGRYNLNRCIRQSFKCMAPEYQQTLIRMHVFRTCSFDLEDAIHILEGSAEPKLVKLKYHHFVELKCENGNCSFSIHPLISYFLDEEIQRDDEMKRIYNNAIPLFLELVQKKIESYENLLEDDFNEANDFFLKNEANFNQYFRLLLTCPSNRTRTIKLNKQISAVADLLLNNEKKCRLMERLKYQCKEEKNVIMACFWAIKEAEEYLDADRIEKAEASVDKVESDLKQILPDNKMNDMITLLLVLLHLKARIYFRKDSFDEAYESVYTTIFILSDTDFVCRNTLTFMENFTTLHANIYNILGCVLLREKHSIEAYHCFLEAFIKMTKENPKHRSQKMVLFISNMGSCYYREGLELKENEVQNSIEQSKSKFKSALKNYQIAISMRETMNQYKYATYAYELMKRGKVYLELHDTRRAMKDFVNAFKIHYGIESYPHVQITLSLYLTAKAILVEGRGQLERRLNEVAKGTFKYASSILACVADCIKYGGLLGFKEEFDEIKTNHIWLLEEQNAAELEWFKDLYKRCEECGVRGSVRFLEIALRRNKNLKSRHENVLNELKNKNTDELMKVFDEKTKRKLQSIEPYEEEEIQEEIDRTVDDLPYHMNLMDDDNPGDEPDENFFRNILSRGKDKDHETSIEKIKKELHDKCKESTKTNLMALVRTCEENCQKDDSTRDIKITKGRRR